MNPNEDANNTMRWDADKVRKAEETYRRTNGSRVRRSEKQKKRERRSWWIFVLVVSAILAEISWLMVNDICSLNKKDVTTVIEVTTEDNLNTVSKKLKEGGLVDFPWLFRFIGGLRHAKEKIGVGSYELSSDMDYVALINGMRSSQSGPVRVSIPEGTTVRQIVSLLAKHGVNEESALLDAAMNGDYDYDFLRSDRKGSLTYLEGYLFPDTYDFFIGEEPEHAFSRLLDNFKLKMDDKLMKKVSASGYSLDQIVIMASLIEKETDGEDQRQIASVIYNRLNHVGETAHLLQIDASLIYGLGEDFDGKLDQKDMENDTPYNLSNHKGLPPTPIANPGLFAIEAAVEPENTDYYFYALGKDMAHHFFKTYREHANFVNSSEYGG